MWRYTLAKTKKLTLLKVAVYFFLFAVCTKGVAWYAGLHPTAEKLLDVRGIVRERRLGGPGSATWLIVESDRGTYRYSSYYGYDWPGLERIRPGDQIDLRAEHNRLNRDEWIEGRRYYIWELFHQGQVIICYADVAAMVHAKEAKANRLINYWLVISLILLIAGWFRRSARTSS